VEVGAGIWYAARLALLAVTVVIALVVALVQARRRRFVGPGRAIVASLVAIGAAVFGSLSALRPNPLWVGVALVAGAGLGVVLGRLAEPATRGGRPSVKRRPLAQVIACLGYVVFSAMVLFGTPMLAALALLWVVMGLGMVAGAHVGEWSVAPKQPVEATPVATEAAPAPAEAAPAATEVAPGPAPTS
jgi:hypothetical protein